MRSDVRGSPQRVRGNCEECAFDEAAERGRVTGDLYPPTTPDDTVLATEDTLVPDPHVEGRFTLVKAGDPLPAVG
jgi:hypothetical protein